MKKNKCLVSEAREKCKCEYCKSYRKLRDILIKQQLKIEAMKKIGIEEKCKCGRSIPRGYGYYTLCNPLKCFGCGRINKRKKPESPRELGEKIKGVIPK